MRRPRWTAKMKLFKRRHNYQQKTVWYTQLGARCYPLVGWALKTRKVLDTNQPIVGTYYQKWYARQGIFYLEDPSLVIRML